MKILMLAPQPFFEPRGTPISVYQRLTALSQLGYHVDLVTYHIGESPDIPNVTIHRTWHVPSVNEIKIGPSWIKPILDLFIFIKAFLLLLRRRYDVIHTHEEAAFMAIVLAPLFRTRHLYDMHSSLPRQLINYGVGNWWPLINIFEWLERLVINTCDAVITIDQQLEEQTLAINPKVNQLRVENISMGTANGRSAATLRHQHNLYEKMAVVYTGSFERYQGLDLIIRSIQKVKTRFPQVSYIMVGGKADQIQQLQALAADLNIGDSVQFPGIVSPDEALAYLEAADILISSRTEGTAVPLKVYSYLHAGKPIVATDLEAHTQVFDAHISMLVPPTADALADGVITLIDNPNQMAALGQKAKRHALKYYSRENYIAKMAEIYKSLTPKTAVTKTRLLEN